MKKGFTLVELAIVLVIIGIIIGGALRSVEIIKNAKAKKIISQVTALADAQNTFYERMYRFAGDENNDGQIDYTALAAAYTSFDNTGSGNDIDSAFTELKNLQILSAQSNAVLAQIDDGGPAFFSCGNSTSVNYLNAIIIRNVPCLAAFQMEINIDKNQPDDADSAGTGRVRGMNTSTIYVDADNAAWTSTTTGLCSNPDSTTNIAYLFDKF